MTIATRSTLPAVVLSYRHIATATLAGAAVWAGLLLPGDLDHDAHRHETARDRPGDAPWEPAAMLSPILREEIARRYGTPAVVIDLDRVARNIARLQAA